ncbi:MAG: DNA polymerase III subunit beta [Dehalococcoidia bacterium]|nr:DNA polymerase III subunit beta [Dehalococcoidia bacterium]
MKLSCLQENLNRGLGIVGRAVAVRSTLPITQNVLLKTDQGGVRLSATNLEIAISVWIGAQVEEAGALTVPARLLTDFVGSLPAERVDVEVPEGGRSRVLQVQCARVQTRINGTDAEEFPPIPLVAAEGATVVKFDPQVLRSSIAQVAMAAATEDSRPVLTGVKVELEGEQFTLAAADGFRLAVRSGRLKEPVASSGAGKVEFILPAKTLAEVSRLLPEAGKGGDVVEMVVAPNKNQVLFRLGPAGAAGQVELVSQLIQGTFPNYKQLIPEAKQTRATVNVAGFLRNVRTASIFARDGGGLVRVHLIPGSPGVVRTVARAEELGETTSELDARIEGPEAKIAFSSRYLAEVLQVLGGDEVYLDVTNPSSPGVFRPASPPKDGAGDTYTHVVMPMFVQW